MDQDYPAALQLYQQAKAGTDKGIPLQEQETGDYEEDHLISLQLGGHPRDPKNLWPQPYNQRCGARIKDVVETRLKRMVCDGKITLAKAQEAIAKNWVLAYKNYVNKEGCPALEDEQ